MESPSNDSLDARYWNGYSLVNYSSPSGDQTPFWRPGNAYLVRGIFTLICVIGGILFNSFILVAVLSNRKLRSVRNIFVAHLGMVGLISSCTTVSVSCVALLRLSWVGGYALCQVYAYMFSMFYLVSVWIITALSWDKYQTIVNPLHHCQTASFFKMVISFSICWTAGLTLSLPPLVGGNVFVFHPAMAICTIQFTNSVGLWYSILFLTTGALIPLVILTYCYAHIFKIARTQSSKIAASMIKMVSIIQAPITTTPPRSISIKGKRAIGTILHIVGAFLITYIPFAMMATTEMVAQRITSEILSSVSASLVLSAPVVNGAVYGLKNRILRESFSTFIRKKYKRFIEHGREFDNGMSRRGSCQSMIRRNSSNVRLSMLVRKCELDSPNRHLSRTQSLRTRTLTAPPSPAFTALCNGTGGLPQPPIHRVHSMPMQHTEDIDFQC